MDASIAKHYLFYTSLVSGLTALANIVFIVAMAYKLDQGLGLAAIGIVTFFGVALSSSIFEEHRHGHERKYDDKIVVGKDVDSKMRQKLKDLENIKFEQALAKLDKAEKKDLEDIKKELRKEYLQPFDFIYVNKKDPYTDEDGRFIYGVIAGTGIMRKALAASLVMTYIVLIGFSFTSDTLYADIGGENKTASAAQFVLPTFEAAGQTSKVIKLQENFITNVATEKTGTESGKSIEEQLLAKNPTTLIQHFTIVVSVVIGFYFGSNTFSSLLDKYKWASKNKGQDDDVAKTVKEIKERLDKIDPMSDKNKVEQYKKLQEALNKKIGNMNDPATQKEISDIVEKMKEI